MNTRARILAEAESQLLDRGYSAFTIASVREALGLSSGSMFHAFASKPVLVAEVFVKGMQDYQEATRLAMASATTAEDSLTAWIAAHLHWVERNRDLARFLFSTQPEEVLDAASDALAQANDAFFASISAVLESAVQDGVIAVLDEPTARSLIIGPTQEYCRQWTRGAATLAPTRMTELFQSAALAAMDSTRTRGTIT